MKAIISLVAFIFFVGFVNAQEVIEKELDVSGSNEVKLDFDFADEIKVTGWDKSNLKISVTYQINDGQDNDKFSLDIDEEDKTLNLKGNITHLDKLVSKTISIDKDGNQIVEGECISMEIYVTVFMPKNMNIEIETISGDINLNGILSAMDINTISGDIDISLNKTTKADLSMSTISGSMYADEIFKIRQKPKHEYLHHIGGGDVESELNGGGFDIELNTISGNIYLRKI